LYSPSGAGKTSLIQAALIPQLSKMKFQVLPVVRLDLDVRDNLAGREVNNYLFSTCSPWSESPHGGTNPHTRMVPLGLEEYANDPGKR
jgi:hypothetical protein